MSTTGDPMRRSGPGMTAWRGRWAAPPRTQYTSETKPFFLTSEFLAYVLLLMGLGIASGTNGEMDARWFWTLATAATAFYMLSRGIAKSGTKSRSWDPREDPNLLRRGGGEGGHRD